jgi:hypothetical protein
MNSFEEGMIKGMLIAYTVALDNLDITSNMKFQKEVLRESIEKKKAELDAAGINYEGI